MNDRWTDRLSEYLDGDLPPAERGELEAHLETCASCAAALDDLRDVVARARGLRELDASIGIGSDLWPGIEARIRDLPAPRTGPAPGRAGGGSAGHRMGLAVPQLAAVAAVVIAVAGVVLWIASDFGRRDEIARAAADSHRITAVAASTDQARDARTEIARLKQSLESRRGRIDPELYGSLRESVQSVEDAVEDAARALDADPGNPYIKAHLEEMRARQLDLLRRAVALADGAE
jgi:hypothetical protein